MRGLLNGTFSFLWDAAVVFLAQITFLIALYIVAGSLSDDTDATRIAALIGIFCIMFYAVRVSDRRHGRKKSGGPSLQERLNRVEKTAYRLLADEIETKNVDKGLYLRCLLESGNDREQAEFAYQKLRLEEIRASLLLQARIKTKIKRKKP